MSLQLQFIRFYLINFVFQLGFLYLSVEFGSFTSCFTRLFDKLLTKSAEKISRSIDLLSSFPGFLYETRFERVVTFYVIFNVLLRCPTIFIQSNFFFEIHLFFLTLVVFSVAAVASAQHVLSRKQTSIEYKLN